MPSAVSPRPVRYSRASAPSGERSCSSNHAVADFVQIQQFASLAMFGGLFRRREFSLGQWDTALLRDRPHRLGKADVLDFLNEGEDVAVTACSRSS